MTTLPSKTDIERLQAEILKFPQYQPPTQHYFCKGIYLRTIWSPKGTIIVGKIHKTEHIYAVLSGRVQVATAESVIELDARKGPQFLTCPPGTKRAVYVLEDAWRMNVHFNPENVTELEQLEDMFVHNDPTSPFLPGNVLQELLT